MKKTTLSIAVLAMLFQSCESEKIGRSYTYKYKLINNGSRDSYCNMVENCKHFEDDKIKLAFHFKPDRITFDFWNKTENPLQIVWDESVLVIGNKSKPIIHNDVKLNNTELPQKNSFIAPKSWFSDMIIEADDVYWHQGYASQYSYSPSEWRIHNRFPTNDYSDTLMRKGILSRKGEIFIVYLTILDGSEKIRYPFNFEIVDVLPNDE